MSNVFNAIFRPNKIKRVSEATKVAVEDLRSVVHDLPLFINFETQEEQDYVHTVLCEMQLLLCDHNLIGNRGFCYVSDVIIKKYARPERANIYDDRLTPECFDRVKAGDYNLALRLSRQIIAQNISKNTESRHNDCG